MAVFTIIVLVTGAFSAIAWFGLPEEMRIYMVGTGAAIGTTALGGLVATAFTDPGIVQFGVRRESAAMCTACNLQKPRNAHHCRICNCCVVNLDHHCGFIGRCIAKNNMRQFNLFVTALWAAAVFMLPTIGFCLVRAVYLNRGDGGQWVLAGVCSIVLVLACFCPKFWMHLLCNGFLRVIDTCRCAYRRVCSPCARSKAKRAKMAHSELRESESSAPVHLPNPMSDATVDQDNTALSLAEEERGVARDDAAQGGDQSEASGSTVVTPREGTAVVI
jgi:hypothetical protein